MATLNMGNSNIIGISYSEMNKMKSNLKKSQQMLETSQRNVGTARVQLQVDRGRLRVTEDSLSSIYTESSKRKAKIDKMCSNIDYTIRRFKEVDSRCAQRIKAIGNSYNTKTSLFDKIKNVMLSLGRYLFGGGTSLLNEGQDAFNNLGSSNSNGYYGFIGRGVGVGNYSAMANSQYSMGGLLLAGTNIFSSYSNQYSTVAMNYHGAGVGKADIDKSENKYEHKYEYYAEKGRNSEGIWESVKNYSIAIWERWVGLAEQIFTQIGLINGMEPKWAKLYGEFSAGMLLENFTAVTINGVKAYKNLKTGQVISESEFIAGSGLGSAGKGVNKSSAKGLIGKDFEDYLTKAVGGKGSFSKGGRDFDGGIANRWWEAKSGQYWDMIANNPKKLELFKSSMGDRLKIAKDNGATYELFSNTEIPQSIKDWLTKKGIPFTEILE